jgi:hypothetical protein
MTIGDKVWLMFDGPAWIIDILDRGKRLKVKTESDGEVVTAGFWEVEPY